MKFLGNNINTKKQVYLLLTIVIIVIVLIFLFVKLSQKTLSRVVQKAVKPTEIRIDFNLLESPIVRDLRIYELISLLKEETTSTSSVSGIAVGRPNPFLPYH